MSRIRSLPPDFSYLNELPQKKPRVSVDSLTTRFEFVDQEEEEEIIEEEEEPDEFANNLSVLDEEEVIEEEEEEEFENYVSESEVDMPTETTEYDIHLTNEGQQQQRLNPIGRTGARMRVNTDYVHYSIQVSQWVEEEIVEEEEVEDDINEFADRDMTEYLETRTYHAPPVVADHEEQEACAICLHEYQDGDTIGILQCNHEFHAECINEWLQRKRTCPFCRAQIDFANNSIID